MSAEDLRELRAMYRSIKHFLWIGGLIGSGAVTMVMWQAQTVVENNYGLKEMLKDQAELVEVQKAVSVQQAGIVQQVQKIPVLEVRIDRAESDIRDLRRTPSDPRERLGASPLPTQ